MREIKFRGKGIKEGIWLFGYYFYDKISDKHFIFPDYFVDPYSRDVFEVISETVGQFTGLKDKNGKDVYKGDTLFGNTGYGVEDLKVVYDEYKFMLEKKDGCRVDIGSGNSMNFESFYFINLLEIKNER